MKFEYFTRKEHIAFRLNESYKERIRAAAHAEDMSISNWLAQTAAEFLQLPRTQRVEAGKAFWAEPSGDKIMSNFMIAPALKRDIEADVKVLGWESNTFWYHTAMRRRLDSYHFRKINGRLAAFKQKEKEQ